MKRKKERKTRSGFLTFGELSIRSRYDKMMHMTCFSNEVAYPRLVTFLGWILIFCLLLGIELAINLQKAIVRQAADIVEKVHQNY